MNDVWKTRLNVLITFYRKKYLKDSADKKWVQKNFYYHEQEHFAVCSNNTYSGLENNRLLADEDVYLFALKKLKKRYNFDEGIEERFLSYIDQLSHEIEYGHTEKLYAIFQDLNQNCGAYQSYIYYEELFFAFDRIKDYYEGKYNCISDQDYRKLNVLMNIFPIRLQNILMELLYCYANMKERKVVDEVLSTYDYEHSTFMPNQITYLLYCRICNKNAMQTIDKIKGMIQQLEQDRNYVPLVDLYMIMSNITKKIDIKYSEDCFYHALSTVEKHDVPERVKLSTYLNAGYYYILLEQYGVALNYLLKALDIKEIMPAKNYACCIFCYHMLNIEVPDKFYALVDWDQDLLDVKLYEFLLYIDERNLEQNVRFLKKNVYKHLKLDNDQYVFIIKHELYRISRPKGRYHFYYDFCERFVRN